MKRLLLALLVISPLSAMELVEHRTISSKDALRLYTNQKEFYVEDDYAAYRVEKHNINPLLAEVIKRQAFGKFKDAGYIRISKLNDSKYALAAHVRGLGGGGGGALAGIMVGKFAVHFVAQLGIGVATAGVFVVGGPVAAGAFAVAAEKTLVPLIEATSQVAAIGCGIVGAAVTGPV